MSHFIRQLLKMTYGNYTLLKSISKEFSIALKYLQNFAAQGNADTNKLEKLEFGI